MQIITEILSIIPAMLIGITVHEYSHGKMADLLGDPTPRNRGRLSLNPIHHLDFLGSLMIFLVHVGWAKPVPVNPANFKNPRQDMMYVGLAGPFANFATAFVFSILLKLGLLPSQGLLYLILVYIIQINVALGIFNLIPIPPLDGSRVLAGFVPLSSLSFYRELERYGVLILILLLVVFPRGFFDFFFQPILNFFMKFFLPGPTWL